MMKSVNVLIFLILLFTRHPTKLLVRSNRVSCWKKSPMSQGHVPVLWESVRKAIKCKSNAVFVDATFGCGGYTRGLLRDFPSIRKVYALDRDPLAFSIAQQLAKQQSNDCITPLLGKFSQLSQLIDKKVDGVLFDVGLSSMQIADSNRGFSFASKSQLDMRMSQGEDELSAFQVINQFPESTLCNIFTKYGDEDYSKEVASAISNYRTQHGIIKTPNQLCGIIINSLPTKRLQIDKQKGVNPARKIFQAIRIHVNQELEELEAGLIQAHSLLARDGLLAVVTFHSLECQIVKRFFDKYKHCYWSPGRMFNPILPSEQEKLVNSRSKSGRLRFAYRNSVDN